MRHIHPVRISSWTAVLLTLVVAAGCSSSPDGPKKKAGAVESFRDTRKGLADASKQVQATNASLTHVSTATSGDLRDGFNKYVENVKKTEGTAKGARKRAEAMRAKTNAYVAEWQEEFHQIQDETLRKASKERASEAKVEFEKVRDLSQEARAAYEPYMTGLKDVEKYLTSDLTASGVQAVKPKADATIKQGETLQQKLAAVEAELDALAKKWSSDLGKPAK